MSEPDRELDAPPPQASPIIAQLTGADFRGALATSTRWVERHAEAINALNVFPVPDGDTGLNMSLTLRSAADYALAEADDGVSAVAAAMARGALMGARGNSGVILAQLLRGLSTAVAGLETIDARDLARALAAGAEAAYGAVPVPVEGTILTVARAAAAAALDAASASADVLGTMEQAERAAREAVARTPELLPILKQAAVVDAGGEGYRVFLDGVVKYLRGEPPDYGAIHVEMRADFATLHTQDGDFFGYCTEVLFQGRQLDPALVRERLSGLGSSVLVVGDQEMLKVHVHTLRPGAVLDLATDLGEIVAVKVDNMQLQHDRLASGAPAATALPLAQEPGTGLVSVAQGEGFQEIFSSLGAAVVPGGETMNPSVGQIAAAIAQVRREAVIVLPNSRNVLLAAKEAAGLVDDRAVVVVPTENLPQGIAAALALNPDADVDANAAALALSAGRCHAIEITRAIRDAVIAGLSVAAGMPFALVNGKVAASDPDYKQLVAAALDRLPHDRCEIATVYVGAGGSIRVASAIASVIEQRLAVAVQILEGGEPNYEYIVSVE